MEKHQHHSPRVAHGNTGPYTQYSLQDDGQQKHVDGAWLRVITAGVLSVGSMAALTALLTWLLFNHHVEVPEADNYSNAGYLFMHNIAFGMPLLLTTLSALLSLVLMAALHELASLVHAHDLVSASEQQDIKRLPITYDFALLVSLLTGSIGGYFRSLKQCTKSGSHSILKKAVILASVPLVASTLIILCDIAIHSAARDLVAPLPAYGVPGTYEFGRQLSKECNQSTFAQGAQFWLNDTGCSDRMDLTSGGSEALATANNKSTTNRILISDQYNLTDFHPAPIAIMTDSRAPAHEAFIATSYGVASWFMDIGENCQLNGTRNSWNCEDHKFNGTFDKTGVAIPDATKFDFKENMIRWVIAGHVTADASSFGTFNQEPYEYSFVVNSDNSSMMTVFHCETAAYKVTYLQQNGHITVQNVSAVNKTTAHLIFGGVFPGMISGYSGFGKELMADHFTTTAKSASDDLDLALSWATTLSTLALASAAGILQPATVHKQGLTASVTLIPKAPYMVILFTDLLYAMFALGLTIAAIRYRLDSRDFHIRSSDVQARLSVMGLAARALSAPHVYERVASDTYDLFDHSADSCTNRVSSRSTTAGGVVLDCQRQPTGFTKVYADSDLSSTNGRATVAGYDLPKAPRTPENKITRLGSGSF